MRRLYPKNSAWLSDSSTRVAWNPSKFINNWVRHATLWTWKMCVRVYNSSKKAERRDFPHFQVVIQDGVHRPNGYAGIGSYLFHSQAVVFHNHLFCSCHHVFRSASAWPRLLRFVSTWRSAFFELLYPRTHIFYVHNTIIACLTQLLMNFDGFHATQVEESDNHVPFFECKRHHFQYLKHYCHPMTSQAFNR